MEGSAALGRCGRLVTAMTRCECAELSFEDLVRRLRDTGGSLDDVQSETGAGLLCTACLPDLREHLAAEGVATPPPSRVRSCVPLEALGSDEPGGADPSAGHEDDSAPRLAATRDPR